MSIDPKLQAVLTEVQTTLGETWKGTLGEALRPWMNFAGIAPAGKFDFSSLFALFDRKKLNDDYLKARQQEAPVSKDIWVPKMSADLLAGFQRDYAMRSRSRIRFLAHSAVRQKMNSQGNGPFVANTITLLAKLDSAKTGE
jgi:hypothetical protein